MNRALAVLIAVLALSGAQAQGFYAGANLAVPGPGLHFGWDSDQGFGVRASVGTIWTFTAVRVGIDLYALWPTAFGSSFYLGGGATYVYFRASGSESTTTYVALQALVGFRVDAPVGFFFEFNPGLVVLRQPPPGFEDIPFGEILFMTRINLGVNVRL